MFQQPETVSHSGIYSVSGDDQIRFDRLAALKRQDAVGSSPNRFGSSDDLCAGTTRRIGDRRKQPLPDDYEGPAPIRSESKIGNQFVAGISRFANDRKMTVRYRLIQRPQRAKDPQAILKYENARSGRAEVCRALMHANSPPALRKRGRRRQTGEPPTCDFCPARSHGYFIRLGKNKTMAGNRMIRAIRTASAARYGKTPQKTLEVCMSGTSALTTKSNIPSGG